MPAQVTKAAVQKPMTPCPRCPHKLSEVWMHVDTPKSEAGLSSLLEASDGAKNSKKEQYVQQAGGKDERPNYQSQQTSRVSQKDGSAEALASDAAADTVAEDGAPLGTGVMTNRTGGENSHGSEGTKHWHDLPDSSSHIPDAPTPLNSPWLGPRLGP